MDSKAAPAHCTDLGKALVMIMERDEKISRLEKENSDIKKEFSDIKRQVRGHLPSSVRHELDA